jgi:hypothetical protein
MAQKTIYYPPRPPLNDRSNDFCLNYNDTLIIQFDESGDLSDSNQNAFTHNIPVGYFTGTPTDPVIIGPYYPKHTRSYVELSFNTGSEILLYKITIQATPPCPPSP